MRQKYIDLFPLHISSGCMDIATIEEKQIQELKPLENETYNNFINQFNSFLSDNNRKLELRAILDYIKEASNFYAIRSMGVLKAALKKGIEETFQNTPYFLQFSHGIDKAFSKIKIGTADSKVTTETLLNDPEIDLLLSGGKILNKKGEEIELIPDRDLFLLIQFLKETGLRISELITLKRDIFVKKENVYYFSFIGKGKKQRKNFILDFILEETKNYYNGKTYLFEFNETRVEYSFSEKERIRKWISHKLNKYSKQILGREINPHDFRHYFATRMLKEGKTIKAIANWLGHSTTSITNDMYVHDELCPEDIY